MTLTTTKRRWWKNGRSLLAFLILLVGLTAVWWCLPRRGVPPWQLLRQVTQMEDAGRDPNAVQMLGWNLAILGRDDEVRSIAFLPELKKDPQPLKPARQDLKIVPWKEGLQKIAQTHRVVMVMENHFASKHREVIGAALPIFRANGFTDYAAEALQEPGSALAKRGYPVWDTGLYTADPRFGNLLRSAITLKFAITGYDFGGTSHESREEYAATTLARIVTAQPSARLLVHAGFAHVLKRPDDNGQRWLASLLWEKTGVEPFTIWQWSDLQGAREYHSLLPLIEQQLGQFGDPVLLMPPPAAIPGGQVPDVDAILVHPRDGSSAPARRTVLFPAGLRQISGEWLTPTWPVVIAARRHGEPPTAVALDQVMLRRGERAFTLWIPAASNYDLVVLDSRGSVKATVIPGPSFGQVSLRVAR